MYLWLKMGVGLTAMVEEADSSLAPAARQDSMGYGIAEGDGAVPII
jgi:hypothetical protein